MDQTSSDATQARRARILETTLDLLIALSGATGGAVLRVAGREGILVRAKDVGPHAIPRCRTAREFDLLSAGPVLRPEYAVLPVRLDGNRTVAFYLEAPSRLRPHSLEVERLLTQVAACLDDRDEPMGDVARTTAVERRRALLELCEREEWCLARVARRLGVSRPTLYRWLSDFGLGRPGGPRRAPARA